MKQIDKTQDTARRNERRANQTGEHAARYYWPAMRRLTEARAQAAKFAERWPDSAHYTDWRNNRPQPFARACVDYAADKSRAYANTVEAFGYDAGDASDLLPGRNVAQGYYNDNDQHATTVASVTMVRTPRGALYIPTTREDEGRQRGVGGYTFHLSEAVKVPKRADQDEHDAAKIEAARAADHIADRVAEESRDHDEAYQAGREYSEYGDTIAAARVEFRKIRAELKTMAGVEAPTLCATIRAALAGIARDYREAKQKRAELVSEWSARWRAEYRATFAEGAETKIDWEAA